MIERLDHTVTVNTGTNPASAIQYADDLFAAAPCVNKQMYLITDGVPESANAKELIRQFEEIVPRVSGNFGISILYIDNGHRSDLIPSPLTWLADVLQTVPLYVDEEGHVELSPEPDGYGRLVVLDEAAADHLPGVMLQLCQADISAPEDENRQDAPTVPAASMPITGVKQTEEQPILPDVTTEIEILILMLAIIFLIIVIIYFFKEEKKNQSAAKSDKMDRDMPKPLTFTDENGTESSFPVPCSISSVCGTSVQMEVTGSKLVIRLPESCVHAVEVKTSCAGSTHAELLEPGQFFEVQRTLNAAVYGKLATPTRSVSFTIKA